MRKLIFILVVLAITAPGFGALIAEKNWDSGITNGYDYTTMTGAYFDRDAGGTYVSAPGVGGTLGLDTSGCYGYFQWADQDAFGATQGRWEIDVCPSWSGINQGGTGIGAPGAQQTLLMNGSGEHINSINVFFYNNGYPDNGGQIMATWQGSYIQNTELQPGGGSPEISGSTEDWIAGQWHNIALEWDVANVRLLLDGLLVSEFDRSITAPFEGDRGGYALGGPGHDLYAFQGVVDNYRLYDTPEPATIALLGLGVLALLRKRS